MEITSLIKHIIQQNFTFRYIYDIWYLGKKSFSIINLKI